MSLTRASLQTLGCAPSVFVCTFDAGAQPSPTQYLMAVLVEEIGLLEKSAALLIKEYGELDVQRHAMYCLWMMDQGKVHIPPAWLTASLKSD